MSVRGLSGSPTVTKGVDTATDTDTDTDTVIGISVDIQNQRAKFSVDISAFVTNSACKEVQNG